ncbi:MAG: Drug resistance transporter EmrB/QacA subfamily [Phycisphaerales bacterium]|nr:Drug resistance transporter EmrB/QacA subfamily [Phycisphaerales bacterium]
MIATFMEVLDTTVVNVALPHIAGSLAASNDEATWVLTSYLVSNAVVLPATGWLSGFFGRKRFLVSCIVLFTIASGLCGVAGSLGMLIVARVLQGAGGGALQPISQAVLLESFPPAKRGVAMGIFGMGVVVAPIIGPTLGGWITDNYSWRWVFYINLPIGILAILMAQAFIEDPPYIRSAGRGRIDLAGLGLLALWVASLQIMLDKGQDEDWFASRFIQTLAVLAVVGLVAFVTWELITPDPIVNLRIFSNRNFAVGTGLMTVLGAVLYGSITLLPLFLQTLMGYPATQSGLAVSPRGVGSMAAMVVVGRLVGIIDARALIAFGFATLGYSLLLFGNFNLGISTQNIFWPNILNGLGTAFVFVPLTTLTMGTLRNEQMGNATGIFNLLRNLGGGVGISTVTAMLTRRAQAHQFYSVSHLTPFDPAYHHFLQSATGAFGAHSGPITGAGQATGQLYAVLLQQAQLWAYVDMFRLMAVLCFICLPGVLLFRRARAHAGPIMVH